MSKYILQAPNCWHQFQSQTQQLHAGSKQARLPEIKNDNRASVIGGGDDGRLRPGEEMWA